MNARQEKIAVLCDGVKTSRQIAELTGDSQKYVQSVFLKFDLPRRSRGSSYGEMNGAYKTGRRIDRDGYALVSAPLDHPYARDRKDRHTGVVYEHRLIMEGILGRYLLRSETVDHIDGLRLHNDPSNLRLFASNAEHLKTTITGQIPSWSALGRSMINVPLSGRKPVDTYNRMKKSGDARLREILRTLLILGIDSPFLLGTSHHLEKAGIFDLSQTNLQRELAELYQRYA